MSAYIGLEDGNITLQTLYLITLFHKHTSFLTKLTSIYSSVLQLCFYITSDSL